MPALILDFPWLSPLFPLADPSQLSRIEAPPDCEAQEVCGLENSEGSGRLLMERAYERERAHLGGARGIPGPGSQTAIVPSASLHMQ